MTEKLKQLEFVRAEAIRFLAEEQTLNWHIHIKELKAGGAMFLDDTYRIGRWTFDFESLILLRDADIASEVRRYGLVFEKKGDSKFRIIRDLWERESYDFRE